MQVCNDALVKVWHMSIMHARSLVPSWPQSAHPCSISGLPILSRSHPSPFKPIIPNLAFVPLHGLPTGAAYRWAATKCFTALFRQRMSVERALCWHKVRIRLGQNVQLQIRDFRTISSNEEMSIDLWRSGSGELEKDLDLERDTNGLKPTVNHIQSTCKWKVQRILQSFSFSRENTSQKWKDSLKMLQERARDLQNTWMLF